MQCLYHRHFSLRVSDNVKWYQVPAVLWQIISQHTKITLTTIFSVPRNCDVASSQATVTPYHVYSTPCTHHSRATGMMGLSFCPFLTYFTPKTHKECPDARFSVDRIHCLTVCIVVVVLFVLSSYVYLFYYVGIVVFYFRCRTAG